MTVFISYAHENKKQLSGFFHRLRPLEAMDPSLKQLSDRDIEKGKDWRRALKEMIRTAEGAILLVSDEFLTSEYCREEAQELYRRLPEERILPVLVSGFLWRESETEWLNRHQFVNDPEEPVVATDPATGRTQEARWEEIVKKIWEARKLWPSAKPPTAKPGQSLVDGKIGMEDLEDALSPEGGGMAFFLGPGIHETQGNTPAADHLRVRFDLLAAKLDDSNAVEYARTIVEAKLRGALDRKISVPAPAEQWRPELVAFQVSLARLGSFASRLVAKTIYRRNLALANIDSLTVCLEREDETEEECADRIELRRLFFEACRRISQLERSPALAKASKKIGLGEKGLLEQLMALTYVVFGLDPESRDPERREWHEIFYKQLRSSAREKILPLRLGKAGRLLALTHLEWLGDLLWHTLRFDTPLYPRPGDLAFQLSVCAPQFTPPRRENIGTIAPLVLPGLRRRRGSIEKVRADVQRVKAWLEAIATADHHEIYYAVARALCDAWNRERRSEGHLGHQVSLAVTTNFDSELERILSAARISHQILFPVHCIRETTDERGSSGSDEEQGWMLFCEQWEEGERHPIPSWQLLKGDELENLDPSHGPLLVKLYGSPLTNIRQDQVLVRGEKNPGRLFEFIHCLIVSDLDLLGVMVQEDWWPAGLSSLLIGQRNRLICFLGYSPADVDSRLRLFEHVRRYKELERVPVVVMSPPEDPIYSEYLLQMRTQALPEGLDQICQVINKLCECKAVDELRRER